MAYIVTENCKDCKYTYCVSVCPVNAFHEADRILYINPDSCIDCNACMAECPVDAIYPDFDIPKRLEHWIQINLKESMKYPVIKSNKSPLIQNKCG